MIRVDKQNLSEDEQAYAKALGAQISASKKKAGLSFDDLAATSGISRATVTRIVYGTIDARVADLRRLSEVLEVPLEKWLDAATKASVKK